MQSVVMKYNNNATKMRQSLILRSYYYPSRDYYRLADTLCFWKRQKVGGLLVHIGILSVRPFVSPSVRPSVMFRY